MLCLSNRARDEAAAIYPAAAARMTTLYSGVDDARFPAPATSSPPLSETGKPPVCLFVGQDFARKGLDIAIHAIADHPSAILRVIGGDDPAPYRAIAERRSVADRVEFVGATRDVARHLAEASALLLPARREPFGMVAVEAMLCGVPPIVSDVTGVSEILHDGIDGKIIATNNPETWAAAIHDVLTHHAQYAAACAARRSELSYDSHLARLIEIYERVVAEKSK
jgi:UDP-glucose:(heptosyl)LPS alpha-1,3-glucosyltransferase